MKEGWKYKKIGELFQTYAGGTPLKQHKEYYQGGDIPWLRSGEVCQKYITRTEMFITQKGLENSSARYFPKDTVVIAMYGATAAQVGILKIKTTSNQAVCGILPNDNYSPEFIYYWFTYNKGNLASQAQGGAQPNISQIKIKNVLIPLLPLSEQQRIVSYLDSAFAKIDAVAKNAEDSLNEAKALFQSALAKMMEPKEGWKEKLLGEVCDTVTDFVAAGSFADLRKNVVYQNSLSYAQLVRTTDLKSQFRKGHFVYVTKDAFNYLYRVNLNEVSIILPNVGVNCGEVYYVDPNMLPYENNVLGPNAVLVKSKLLNMKFLSYAFKDKFFQKQLSNITSNMAQPKFNKTALKKLTIVFPPIENQKAISDELDIIASKIKIISSNLSRTLAECSALKQSILRQTFE